MFIVIAFVIQKILGSLALLPLIAVFVPTTPIAAYSGTDWQAAYIAASTSSTPLKVSPGVSQAASKWSWQIKPAPPKPVAVTPKPPIVTQPVIKPVPIPVPIPKPTPTPTPTPTPSTGREVTFSAYITGYSYWDNTPPGSPDISNGVIHSVAGGTGTYSDPITVAVGHTITGGKDILDYPEGTKFYFPHIKKYGIVEDTCGDGSHPQDGPCHTGYQGKPWLDLYVGGKSVSRSLSDDCMDKITDVFSVIKNPNASHPVVVGELSIACQIF